jgi:hypothetical protein
MQREIRRSPNKLLPKSKRFLAAHYAPHDFIVKPYSYITGGYQQQIKEQVDSPKSILDKKEIKHEFESCLWLAIQQEEP